MKSNSSSRSTNNVYIDRIVYDPSTSIEDGLLADENSYLYRQVQVANHIRIPIEKSIPPDP